MATVQTRHPELLDAEGHICAFFHSLDEEYQVLLPFIREGLSRGERIFYIVDPELRVRGVEGLRVADASVMPVVQSGNCHAGIMMIAERLSDWLTSGSTAMAAGGKAS